MWQDDVDHDSCNDKLADLVEKSVENAIAKAEERLWRSALGNLHCNFRPTLEQCAYRSSHVTMTAAPSNENEKHNENVKTEKTLDTVFPHIVSALE